MPSLLSLFCVILPLRLFNAFTVQTFFQPDEFFQALEPAHKMVYGYGYLTWEWKEGLRSSLHPLLYVAAYKLASLAPPPVEELAVWAAPRIVGALVATIGEVYLYKFALAYSKSIQVAAIAVLLSLSSSWNWFFSTRAFSNNLEMVLTTIGLAYWPWRGNSVALSCLFGFISCVVRPTNALLWGYLGLDLLLRLSPRSLLSLSVRISSVLVVVLSLSAFADRYFYGKWTFPLYNFLEFNVFRNLLIFYGAAPWHFYIFQGLPLMLMGFLPLLLWSLWVYKLSVLVPLSGFVIGGFSLIAHKEFRFIYPLYPVFMVICAMGGRRLMSWRHRNKVVILVVILHACVACFFTRYHESGEIEVIDYLKQPSVTSVGFLTPCHSTPWHSMLHRSDLTESWFLTCEPPLHLASGNLENVRLYRDELDQFYDDPVGFLRKHFPPVGTSDTGFDKQWPSHLVIFEPMEETVKGYVGDSYTECARFFNSYFHWDGRRNGDVVVLCQLKG